MLIGTLMILIGGIGTPLVRAYIASDRMYTYQSPLTSHEILVLSLFTLFLLILILGICMMIFAVIKKRNADHLTRISHLQKGGTMAGICPSCSLNLSPGTTICPRCGTAIPKTSGHEIDAQNLNGGS